MNYAPLWSVGLLNILELAVEILDIEYTLRAYLHYGT